MAQSSPSLTAENWKMGPSGGSATVAEGPRLRGAHGGHGLHCGANAEEVPSGFAQRFASDVIQLSVGMNREKLRIAVGVCKDRDRSVRRTQRRDACGQDVIFGQLAV